MAYTESSSATAVGSSITAYTLQLLRKRDAITNIDWLSDQDKQQSDSSTRVAQLREQVSQAYEAARGDPANGNWFKVVQLLRLSSTSSRAYRWLAPQKQPQSSQPFDLELWDKQVSDLLRRRWKPKSGPEYEKELLRRAQYEWKPTEAFPTRETVAVKQILEKSEWAHDIQLLVQLWLTTTTSDPLTEIGEILEKEKLVKGLPSFLESLIPLDATDVTKVKDFEKEQWIAEISSHIGRKGSHTLVRNSTSNLSFTSNEKKKIALQEKVNSWQQGVAAQSEGSKQKRQMRLSGKQSSIEFTASKPSAARLAVAAKSKASTPRNPPQDDGNASTDHDIDIVMPSQPLSFRSSQIYHSTPKPIKGIGMPSQAPSFRSSQIKHSTPIDRANAPMPSPIEEPIPSSSLPSDSPFPSSPSRRPRPGPTGGFKRPHSPSHSIHSRPGKQARLDPDNGSDSPMAVDTYSASTTKSKQTRAAAARGDDSPMAVDSTSNRAPSRSASSLSSGKYKEKEKKLPTLTQLLSARKAQSVGTPKKKMNTLAIVPSPFKTGPGSNKPLSRSNSVSAPAAQNTSAKLRNVAVSEDKDKTPQSPPSPNPNAESTNLNTFPKPPINGHAKGDQKIAPRVPNAAQHPVLETQTSTSVMTTTSTVQHQPEFTASGYALDLELSVLDGNGNGKQKRDKGKGKETAMKKKKGYFGMDDIDLTSPTRLKPGIVRPYADESGDEDEDVTLQKKIPLSALDESQLPDFTHDFDAFDPPLTSTQPQLRRNSSSGSSSYGYGGDNDFQYGFGARPWENGRGVDDGDDDDDDGEEEEEADDYAAPEAIFTKDGSINVRSLDDDPTTRSPAFFSIPGLNSPSKKNRGKNRDWKGENEDEHGSGHPVWGYNSQVDVDKDAERIDRFIDRDVSLMDVDEDEDRGEEGGQSRRMWNKWV